MKSTFPVFFGSGAYSPLRMSETILGVSRSSHARICESVFERNTSI